MSFLRAISQLYRSEDEATTAAHERIAGEVLWWRRRNDSFVDGVHMGVAYRVLATRLGLPAEDGWKCVLQYDKPLQNGYGTQHVEMFKLSEQALARGKDIATHVIGEILRHLSLSEEEALKQAEARFVRFADIPENDP